MQARTPIVDHPTMPPVRPETVDADRRRVDFLVIGAPKCGTTTLHVALSLHPRIRMPARGGKELRHFDAPSDREVLDAESLARYHAAWDWHEPDVLRGESSPGYLACPDGPARMRRYRPDLRVVAVLRAPALRAFSSWNMALQKGLERRSFDRAVREELAGVPGSNYLADGCYATHLDRLFSEWPGARLLVLQTEELATDPSAALGRVCDFLGVERRDYARLRRRNVRAHLGAIHPATASLLDHAFAGEVERLERRFGWRLDAWRRAPTSVPRWLAGESVRRVSVLVPGLWPGTERLRSNLARFRSPWTR